MTIEDIVKRYLETHGYDGLYNAETDELCGCGLDDFMPCGGENVMECCPGYKVPCECGDDCGYHIGPAITRDSGEITEPDLDTMARDLWVQILREARGHDHSFKFQIVAAVLRRDDGNEGVALWCPDHGDGDGIKHVREFVREVKQHLVEGESMDLRLGEVYFPGVIWTEQGQ